MDSQPTTAQTTVPINPPSNTSSEWVVTTKWNENYSEKNFWRTQFTLWSICLPVFALFLLTTRNRTIFDSEGNSDLETITFRTLVGGIAVIVFQGFTWLMHFIYLIIRYEPITFITITGFAICSYAFSFMLIKIQ